MEQRSWGRAARQPLIGRDAILDELLGAVDAAVAGQGGCYLLEGEAGIGKTTIVREVAREVADRIDVTWGAGAPDGGAPPFAPWRELLGDATDDVVIVTDDAVGRARSERLRDLGDIVLTSDRPRLHVLEDLHWSDALSIRLAHYVAVRLTVRPLLLIATVRSGEPSTDGLRLALGDLRAVAEHRPIPPLSFHDVSRLLAAGRTDTDTDADLVDVLFDRTRGNPLFVAELLRTIALTPERAAPAVARDVPHRVADLVDRRLRALPEPVTALLEAASVLGSGTTADQLAAFQGCSADVAVDLLDQGRSVQLVEPGPAGTWNFRHEIVRDAVYDAIGPRRRSELHAAALDVIARGAASPALLASHALAGLPVVDPDRAVGLAARAGDAAFRATAYEEATVWFERAIEAAPPSTSPRWTADLLLRCGASARHLGDRDRAQRACLAAAQLTDEPTLAARAALGYADPGADLGIAYRTEDPMTAQLLRRAIDLLGDHDPATVAVLEARLAAELHFSDTPALARELAERAVRRAEISGSLAARTMAAAVYHDAFVVGIADAVTRRRSSDQLLEWAVGSGDTTAVLTARRARVFDRLGAADLDGMHQEILAFRRLADPLAMATYDWWPGIWAAMEALLQGRLERSEHLAADALATGTRAFPQLAIGNYSFLLFFLRREQGRLGELEPFVREYTSERADIPALEVGLTFLLAECGSLGEARARLAALDDELLRRLRDRNWPASWFQLARASFLVGDADAARTLLDLGHTVDEVLVTVSLATVCLGASDLARAWLHHAAGDLDAAEHRYVAAAATNARVGARSWRSQAQADHARLLVERDGEGDRANAATLLDEAASVADELGLVAIGRQVAELRGRSAPVGAAASAAVTGTFHREGDSWEVAFVGHRSRVAHTRGMDDLALLLGRPGRALAAVELARSSAPTRSADRGAPALDERARDEIARRLSELEDDIDLATLANDDERAARAAAERDAIVEQVSRDLGLRGRTRRIGDDAERARKTVSTRIRRTIARIGRVNPALGQHLDRSVDTGAWCAYRPEQPVIWQL